LASTREFLEWFESMTLIRTFEDAAIALYQQGTLHGTFHPCAGLEASAVGSLALMQKGDLVFTHHRPMGHCLAAGLDPNRLMAELFGRKEGYCKGKGGSKHIAAVAEGFIGAGAIVAGMLPIAVGSAYARKLAGGSGIVIAFFGEGAVNQGVFHEALNLSSVFRTPILFVCENNLWAENTQTSLVTGSESIPARVASYQIPVASTQGLDVEEVHQVASTLVAGIRGGSGPAFLEVRASRMHGHSSYVTNDARPDREREFAATQDPVAHLEQRLTALGVPPAELAERRAKVERLVRHAIEYATALPEQEPGDAFEDVYSPVDLSEAEVAAR
jgi:acetoin:2,6-dichlorophenolindophenol oxidoreductase subunit alpha